jgi:uncharacterized protein
MPVGIMTAVFMMGLLSGIHCASMCGGIITVLSQSGLAQPQPVQFYSRSTSPLIVLRTLPYHLGRISSYSLLGGLIASFGPLFLKDGSTSKLLYLLANSLLILIGIHFLSKSIQRLSIYVETISLWLLKPIQPYLTRSIVYWTRKPSYASRFILGLLWGLLPCGTVYSALALAAFAGHAYIGAFIMFIFGVSTLPNMLLMGSFLQSFRYLLKQIWLKRCVGVMMISFGALGFVRLSGIKSSSLQWLAMCLGA